MLYGPVGPVLVLGSIRTPLKRKKNHGAEVYGGTGRAAGHTRAEVRVRVRQGADHEPVRSPSPPRRVESLLQQLLHIKHSSFCAQAYLQARPQRTPLRPTPEYPSPLAHIRIPSTADIHIRTACKPHTRQLVCRNRAPCVPITYDPRADLLSLRHP